MSVAESIGKQLSKVTVRANSKMEDLAGRANNSGDAKIVDKIFVHFTGSNDVWLKFVAFTKFLLTGNKSHLLMLDQELANHAKLPKNNSKKKLSKKKVDIDWMSYCENDEDPITLNKWSDYKHNEIVSIALPNDPKRRFCYERAGLLHSLQRPASTVTIWDAKNYPVGTVYRNPRGQYMNAKAYKLLAGPNQFFQLTNSKGKQRVGLTYEDAAIETIFGVKRIGQD